MARLSYRRRGITTMGSNQLQIKAREIRSIFSSQNNHNSQEDLQVVMVMQRRKMREEEKVDKS